MRITGGLARGISIKAPPDDATRPATDQMREAVFSSLGERVLGARCLDLFAGTGSYGLEALSRGAGECRFVEQSTKALTALRRNLAALERAVGDSSLGLVDLRKGNVFKEDLPTGSYDLVFCDPPYELLEARSSVLFNSLITCLSGEGLLVLEAPAQFRFFDDRFIEVRRLGKKKGRNSPSVRLIERA